MNMWINKTEIEQRSLQLRQEHNIQTYGVKDIFSLISQREIHLIRYPFGKDKVLGFSTCFQGNKLIVSNSSEILSREIFTVAHELGHVIYDLENGHNKINIDFEIVEDCGDLPERRAFYFANCFLMPEEEIRKYIKYELKKKHQEIGALDIVRMQLEFQVSYAATVVRLFDIGVINYNHKSSLFDNRNAMTSAVLFKKLDMDERLLKPSNVTVIPPKYLEYVISNYENNYIPFASLEKALALIGMDAGVFKKEKEDEDGLDIQDIFEEFEI